MKGFAATVWKGGKPNHLCIMCADGHCARMLVKLLTSLNCCCWKCRCLGDAPAKSHNILALIYRIADWGYFTAKHTWKWSFAVVLVAHPVHAIAVADLQLLLGPLEAAVLLVVGGRLEVDVHVVGGLGRRRHCCESKHENTESEQGPNGSGRTPERRADTRTHRGLKLKCGLKLDKKKKSSQKLFLPLTGTPPPSVARINLKYSDSLSLWILLILPSAFCWQLTSPALMEISLLLTAGSFEGRPADTVAGSSAAQSRRTESPSSSESPKTPARKKNSLALGWQQDKTLSFYLIIEKHVGAVSRMNPSVCAPTFTRSARFSLRKPRKQKPAGYGYESWQN